MGSMKDIEIRLMNGGRDAVNAAIELMPQWYAVTDFLPEDKSLVLIHCVMPDTGESRLGVSEWTEGSGWENVHEFLQSTVAHWSHIPELP